MNPSVQKSITEFWNRWDVSPHLVLLFAKTRYCGQSSCASATRKKVSDNQTPALVDTLGESIKFHKISKWFQVKRYLCFPPKNSPTETNAPMSLSQTINDFAQPLDDLMPAKWFCLLFQPLESALVPHIEKNLVFSPCTLVHWQTIPEVFLMDVHFHSINPKNSSVSSGFLAEGN